MKRSILTIAISLMMLGFSGCEKKEDTDASDCTEKVMASNDAFQQKAIAYSNNPTVANCNAMKQALMNHIKVCEGCISAAGASTSQIQSLKAQAAALDCSK